MNHLGGNNRGPEAGMRIALGGWRTILIPRTGCRCNSTLDRAITSRRYLTRTWITGGYGAESHPACDGVQLH
jgi:hypothetical protein